MTYDQKKWQELFKNDTVHIIIDCYGDRSVDVGFRRIDWSEIGSDQDDIESAAVLRAWAVRVRKTAEDLEAAASFLEERKGPANSP